MAKVKVHVKGKKLTNMFNKADQKYKESTPKDQSAIAITKKGLTMTQQKQKQFLKEPKLLKTILEQLDKKIMGEFKAKKNIFLHASHIWVKNPTIKLHTFINSESSAGKSYTTRKIYDMFPDNLKMYRNKITNEAFTYWHRTNVKWTWDGKLLLLDDPKEELLNGDTFKTMLSEGSKATVVINQVAIDIDIKGTPNVLLTTANNKPNDEVENRFNFINLDESESQTINIYKMQAEQSSKSTKPSFDFNIKQCLTQLKMVKVVIPYGDKLWGVFPSKSIRGRRDFPRFLELIKTSAALHQYQREKDGKGNVLASGFDYEVARSVIVDMNINEHLVVLTHSLKKAYELCKDFKGGWFTIEDIYKAHPIKSERQWYRNINRFLNKSLLEVDIIVTEGKGKNPQLYRALNIVGYKLPNFKQVIG